MNLIKLVEFCSTYSQNILQTSQLNQVETFYYLQAIKSLPHVDKLCITFACLTRKQREEPEYP